VAGLIQSYLLAERPERLAAVSRLFSFRSMRDPAVGPWMKVISKRWQMYPAGVIFGLAPDAAARGAVPA
jgi:high-affinity nickel permease